MLCVKLLGDPSSCRSSKLRTFLLSLVNFLIIRFPVNDTAYLEELHAHGLPDSPASCCAAHVIESGYLLTRANLFFYRQKSNGMNYRLVLEHMAA